MTKCFSSNSCCSDNQSGCQTKDQSCCNCCECCSCRDRSSCRDRGSSQQDYSEQLLSLADCAWMEVLKEKIKEHIKIKSSSHIDQMAKIVTEANHARWEHKMASKQLHQDLRCSLASMTSCSCCKQG